VGRPVDPLSNASPTGAIVAVTVIDPEESVAVLLTLDMASVTVSTSVVPVFVAAN